MALTPSPLPAPHPSPAARWCYPPHHAPRVVHPAAAGPLRHRRLQRRADSGAPRGMDHGVLRRPVALRTSPAPGHRKTASRRSTSRGCTPRNRTTSWSTSSATPAATTTCGPTSSAYPGLVVLHDAQLHHSRAASLIRRGRETDYRAEFAFSHPGAPASLAEFVVNGLQGSPYYLWPHRRVPLAAARAVAVHNAWLADDSARGGAGYAGCDDPDGHAPARRFTPDGRDERDRVAHLGSVRWSDAREARAAGAARLRQDPRGRSRSAPAAGRRSPRSLRRRRGSPRPRHRLAGHRHRLRRRRRSRCVDRDRRPLLVPALADLTGNLGVVAAVSRRRQANRHHRPRPHGRGAHARPADLAAATRLDARR